MHALHMDLPRHPLAASKYYNRLLINYLEAEVGFWVMRSLFHWSTLEVKSRSNIGENPKPLSRASRRYNVLEALLQEDALTTTA